jgi:sigma-B regulation protein RsbU (phosphoserine phosphatase)
MFNKSIAYRLSIYISLAVVAVFLVFIFIAYVFNNNILKSNVENKATSMGYQAKMLGERQLVSTKEITSNISDQVLYFAYHNDVDFLVSKLMDKYQYLNAIHVNIDSVVPDLYFHNYYMFRDADSIYTLKGNELVYHCRNEQSIFRAVTGKDTPGWTEEFTCHKNNKLVVSYYSPIKILDKADNLITVGSVIAELSLLDLADSINTLKIGESGYAFLVAKDGTYLSHPKKEWIMNKNLFNISEKEYSKTQSQISNLLNNGEPGSTIAYPQYMNYEKCWIYYTPIKETGWTLIFVVPYDELFVPLYLLILRMLFFAVLGILVIFFTITYISNRLIYPLSKVTSQLKSFSSDTGNFEVNTRNEIELVSASLENIKKSYERFKIDQFKEEKLNTQRMQDLMEASEIQMSLINTDFTAINSGGDVKLFATYHPARIVSGDLYDFFFLDEENLYFTIGDVSGKGLSAAFYMSVAQTLLKSNSRFYSPGKIVANANNELYTNNQHQFFLTLLAGVLNVKTGVLFYCNAAHTVSLIVTADGEITELTQTHGMPLGLYPNRTYSQSEALLNPGDSIVLYSDGVTEMQNEDKMHFGNERFFEVLRENANLYPRNLIDEIENSLADFRGMAKQSDDVTIMVIKRP